MREQLLEGEAALRRVASGGELGEPRLARRVMQVAQRLRERRQSRRQQRTGGEPVARLALLKQRDRRLDERAQPPLGHAGGERVDRGERLLERRGGPGDEAAVLRVHHLEPERAAAHLAEAAQPRAAREALLLARREIEEAQREHPRAVGDAREELAAAAVDDLGELHLAFHRGAGPRGERAERRHVRAVLVAQRQQEKEVLDPPHPEVRQALRERGAHAPQRRHGPLRGALLRAARGPALHGGGRGAQGRCRTHSISTCAPRGSCATPTTARAG